MSLEPENETHTELELVQRALTETDGSPKSSDDSSFNRVGLYFPCYQAVSSFRHPQEYGFCQARIAEETP